MSDPNAKPLTERQCEAVKPLLHRGLPFSAVSGQSSKLLELLDSTPRDSNRVTGWDEMPAVGAEL